MRPGAWLVVVAAGKGLRLGHELPKALVPLAGRPILAYSLEAASNCDALTGVVVVGEEAPIREAIAREAESVRAVVEAVVPGGETRQQSVLSGLRTVQSRLSGAPEQDPVVLVHDAARPFAGAELFAALARGAESGPLISAEPIVDTVKRVEGDRITETLDRSELVRAQTPQAARLSLLLRAHESAPDTFSGDDAILLERIGETVRTHPGPEWNFKITTPADLELAEALLARGALPAGAPSRTETS